MITSRFQSVVEVARLRTLAESWLRALLPECLAFYVAVAAAASGSAKPPPTTEWQAGSPGQPPIAYRRIFVPADDVSAWPRNGEKYLPVEPREFQELVSAANRGGENAGPVAAITEALYAGRMRPDGGVSGSGSWKIELRGNGPVVLPVGDPSLVVSKARWRDEPTQPVRLGRWGTRNSFAGELGVEVSRSGVLEFDWLLPARIGQTASETPWRFPLALTNRLTLDLPASHEAHIDGGVVLRAMALSPHAAAEGNYRRWDIAFGQSPSTALRIVTADGTSAQSQADVTLREEIAYRLNERGVDIESTLHLEQPAFQLRQLVLPLPEDLQFMSAKADGRELAWQVVTGDRAGSATAVIELPEASGTGGRTVGIRAWHPLVTDQRWLLPKLRPVGTFWSSGEIELSFSPALELQRLVPTDCVQTGVIQMTENRSGAETCWLTAYSPAAALAVTVAHCKPKISSRLGATLSLVEPFVNVRLVTEFAVFRGAVHSLPGTVAAGWNVEGVETIPPSALGEWFIRQDDTGSHLEIQLTDAARPGQQVTLIVAAQLLRSDLAEPLSADTLRVVRWRGIHVDRHFLTVQPLESHSAVPLAGLPLAEPEEVAAEAHALFEDVAGENPVFDLTEAPEDAALRLVPKLNEFHADLSVDVRFDGESIEQVHLLQLTPLNSRIDHVLILANVPFEENVSWTERTTQTPLDARRLTDDDPLRAHLPHGEVWEVRLPRPMSEPVAIVAKQTARLSERMQIPLLSVAASARQQGRVRVLVHGGFQPGVEFERLRPVPAPLDFDDAAKPAEPTPVLAAYRYDPTDCQEMARCPRLWVGPSGRDSDPGLIARRAELASFFSADGHVVHQAVFEVSHHGDVQAELQLPAGARNLVVTLDGRIIESSVKDRPPAPVVIHASELRRPSRLIASFETRQEPLATGVSLRPPRFEGLRVLAGSWTIYLPDKFVPAGAGLFAGDDGQSPRRRLFGPIGRPDEVEAFDPFHFSDWGTLFVSASDFLHSYPDSFSEQTTVVPWTKSELVKGVRSGDEGPIAAPTRSVNVRDDAKFSRARQAEQIRAEPRTLPVRNDRLDGWHAYHTKFVAESPQPVVLTHAPVTGVWSITAFLLCLIAGGRLAKTATKTYITLVAAAAAAALAVPASVAPITTGAFLGLLFSAIVVWPRREVTEDSPTRTWNRAVTGGAIALSAIAAFASSSLAQPPNDAAEPDPSVTSAPTQGEHGGDITADQGQGIMVHSVLIPRNAAGGTDGSKWYVGEQLLRELLALAGTDPMARRDWVLFAGTCEGELHDRDNAAAFAAGDWKLTLSIEVLARDTTITLPLVQSEATWQPVASLDGIPTPITWHADGISCDLMIAEPGRYELSISFRPQVNRVGDRNQIALTIPQLSPGRCALRCPPALAGLEVIGVVPAPPDNNSSDLLVGALDSSGQLTVRWPHSQSPIDDAQGLRVTELHWLDIRAGDVQLQTKYIVEGGTRRPETLTVSYDTRWKLESSNEATQQRSASNDSQRTIRVALPPDDIDRQEVTLQWRLGEAPALGYVKLPPIHLVSLPVSQRWLGVSADPVLDCEILGEGDVSAGTPDEFLTLWSDAVIADDMSLVVARLESSDFATISVRPQTSDVRVVDQLHVAAGEEGLLLVYEADVSIDGSDTYQFPLVASGQIRIDDVTADQGGQEVPLRWNRSADDALQVFFGQGVVGKLRLVVRGHVPRDKSASYALPRLAAADSMTQRVQFYREDNVLLAVHGLNANEQFDDEASQIPPVPWQARAVEACQLTARSFRSVRLVVTPNQVQATGQTLTTLSREADGWWATYDAHVAVQEGMMGSLQLQVTGNWVQPLDVQTSVPSTVEVSAPRDNQTIVTIRLNEPIEVGDALTVRLRGRLLVEPAASVTVPRIEPITAISGPHYVLVPAVLDSSRATWTEIGVRPAVLPQSLALPDFDPGAWMCFQTTATQFRVSLRPVEIDQPTALVRLADTRLAIGPFGGQLMVTRLVVVSSSATTAVLEVPHDQELVMVTSDDREALIRRLDGQRWRLPLGPAQLPQCLEIVSRPKQVTSPNGSRFELIRPRLMHESTPVPVEMSLWSIGHPSQSWILGVEGASPTTAMEQVALRLDRLVGIVAAATPAAVDLPALAGRDWYLPWAARLESLRQQATRTIGLPNSATNVVQVVPSTEEQLTRASEQLDQWVSQCNEIFAWPETLRPPSLATQQLGSSLWEPAQDAADAWFDCVANGDAARLVVHLAGDSATSIPARIRALLIVVAIAGAMIAIMRWPAARDLLWRWPHAAAFLFGLAYWAWLSPSWIGLVIAAGNVWLALRVEWPSQSLRTEGSTVRSTGGRPQR
jgi:hypothetical protein